MGLMAPSMPINGEANAKTSRQPKANSLNLKNTIFPIDGTKAKIIDGTQKSYPTKIEQLTNPESGSKNYLVSIITYHECNGLYDCQNIDFPKSNTHPAQKHRFSPL